MRQTVRLLMGYIPGRNLVALALLMFGSGKYRQVLVSPDDNVPRVP
jgi:hypothetical protein